MLVVIDDASTPVQTYLERILCGPLAGEAPLPFYEALSPEPPVAGCVLRGRTVLFLGRPMHRLIRGDEPALARRLVAASAGHALLVVDVHSVINAYGWASWDASGRSVRTFAGDHEGVAVDHGQPLATELRVDAKYRRLPDGRRQDEVGETWSMDQLGEEYVFALVEAATGFRIGWGDPGDEAEVETFASHPQRVRF